MGFDSHQVSFQSHVCCGFEGHKISSSLLFIYLFIAFILFLLFLTLENKRCVHVSDRQ